MLRGAGTLSLSPHVDKRHCRIEVDSATVVVHSITPPGYVSSSVDDRIGIAKMFAGTNDEGTDQYFQLGCTSGVKAAENCGNVAPGGVLGHYGKDYGGDLTHYVTDPGHQHAVDDHMHTVAADSHLPPYRALRFIERVDNSG